MPAPRRLRATLTDVAALAGVSVGSASRVMHTPEKVRPSTREAVERAAEELGYFPDGKARALASGRSMTIGIVLPTISNPVYAEFVHVLQRQVGAKGYMLLVQAHEYDAAAELAQVRALSGRVDGVVLVGADHDPAVRNMLELAMIPYVVAWSSDEGPVCGGVGFSNRAAMRAVAEHLIGLGHRRLGVISGDLAGNARARGRLDGVAEAAHAAGLEAPAVSVQPFSIAGGRAGLADLLARDAGITAVLCATDLMAAGALAEARDRGTPVPQALSITGFDDIDLAAATTPRLTTVRVPITDMARAAAETLFALIAGGEQGDSLVLPTELILRETTAEA